MLRTIFGGLRGSFNFERSAIEKIACKDGVDREILQTLFETGFAGILPKDLTARLERFKVVKYQVSRRALLRMNKRFQKEFGEKVVEKHGCRWAFQARALALN
jgi:hypothetical protein